MVNQESINASPTMSIRRIGLPVVLQDFGERYLLAVYLSGSPPALWREVLRAVTTHAVSDATSVLVVSDLLTFTAPDADVERWLPDIDRWIDATNRVCGSSRLT
jgi:hypothetical protein